MENFSLFPFTAIFHAFPFSASFQVSVPAFGLQSSHTGHWEAFQPRNGLKSQFCSRQLVSSGNILINPVIRLCH